MLQHISVYIGFSTFANCLGGFFFLIKKRLGESMEYINT